MPLVSILVTVFNRAAYLAETLESIHRSDYRDYEVIVVDDCSSDNSAEIAYSFAQRDSRIQVYQNSHNLGDYPNRNRAASLAQGRYLKYLDADDLIYEHGLGVMVQALESNPEAGLALSSNVIDPAEPYPAVFTPREVFRRHFLGSSPLGVGPSAAIIRRACFEAVGGFSGGQFVGDSELWMKLAEHWDVVSLPPALVWWRRHDGQQMELELKRPQTLNLRHALQKKMLAETRHFTNREKSQAQAYLDHLHARRLLSYGLRCRQPRMTWSLIRESGLPYRALLQGLLRPRTGPSRG